MRFIISTKNKTEREMKMLIPTVLVRSGNRETAYDLYSRMMAERILFVNGEVGENMDILVASALHLSHEDPEKKISIYINSPGGSVSHGLAFIDTLSVIPNPIETICTGMAASMGAMILSHKYEKKDCTRSILPNARVMIHSVANGLGQAKIHDLKITLQETEKYQDKLMRMLANNTGKTYEEIDARCNRDAWFSAEEAVEYGLVDSIVPVVKNK